MHGLLLWPDEPGGTLYSPSRLNGMLNNGSKWKSAVRSHPSVDKSGQPRSWEWLHNHAQPDQFWGCQLLANSSAWESQDPHWYFGSVGLFCSSSGQHQVTFEDTDERWLSLSAALFGGLLQLPSGSLLEKLTALPAVHASSIAATPDNLADMDIEQLLKTPECR